RKSMPPRTGNSAVTWLSGSGEIARAIAANLCSAAVLVVLALDRHLGPRFSLLTVAAACGLAARGRGNKYFKLFCTDCGATLDFGQHKDAALGIYAKRKNDAGKLPNRGWYVYGSQLPPQKPNGRPAEVKGVEAFLARNLDPAGLNGLFPELAGLSP